MFLFGNRSAPLKAVKAVCAVAIVSCLAGTLGSWVAWIGDHRPEIEPPGKTVPVQHQVAVPSNSAEGRHQLVSFAQRELRRPLIDPPAPTTDTSAPAPLPPIPHQVLGTIVEPGNSQAILQIPGGEVKICQVGSSLPDHELATIIEIDDTGVTVQRQGETVHLPLLRPGT